MKILACSDIHSSQKAVKKLVKKAKNVDLIICAGDMSIFEQGLEVVIYDLSKTKKPVLIIHGNHEGAKITKKICNLFDNVNFIHGKSIRIQDILFIGWGGGGFSLADPELRKQAGKLKKSIKKDDRVVFVTHQPPYNTELDLIYDEHAGNKDIRKFIDSNNIEVCISGHLHENEGIKHHIKNKKGFETLLINPGPDGRVINLPKS